MNIVELDLHDVLDHAAARAQLACRERLRGSGAARHDTIQRQEQRAEQQRHEAGTDATRTHDATSLIPVFRLDGF